VRRPRKLQKHHDGRYYARVMRSGRSKRFWFGRNKKLAEDELKRVEKEIAQGLHFSEQAQTSACHNGRGEPDMLVGEMAHKHLEWVEKNRSSGTYKLRQHYLIKFLDYIPKNMMASDISKELLENYSCHCREVRISRNTGNEDMRHVKAFLMWGEESELYTRSFKKFPPIKYVPPRTKKVSPEHLKAFYEAAPDDLKSVIEFMFVTGIRPQEARELTMNQIEGKSDNRKIRIECHKTAITTGEPTPRSVPLSPLAQKVIDGRERCKEYPNHLFLNGHNRPYTRQALRNRFIRVCKKANIPPITPYALRHAFATMLDEKKISQYDLARLMGHSGTRTLLRYVSAGEDHLKSAVSSLDSVFDD